MVAIAVVVVAVVVVAVVVVAVRPAGGSSVGDVGESRGRLVDQRAHLPCTSHGYSTFVDVVMVVVGVVVVVGVAVVVDVVVVVDIVVVVGMVDVDDVAVVVDKVVVVVVDFGDDVVVVAVVEGKERGLPISACCCVLGRGFDWGFDWGFDRAFDWGFGKVVTVTVVAYTG